MSILLGTRPEVSVQWRDPVTLALLDDAATAALFTKPDGTTGGVGTITHASLGTYLAVLPADTDQSGVWIYTADAPTLNQRVEGSFIVEAALTATMYATLGELRNGFSIDDSEDDDKLQRVLIASSRAIDEFCGRRFYTDATATARVYRAPSRGPLYVDDIASSAGVIVKTDSGAGTYPTTLTVTTDYILEPFNALAMGRPITSISHVSSCFPNYSRIPGVQVTAKWGWPSTPPQVREACLIKAARLFRRKDTPEGVAGVGDFGVVMLTGEDADVKSLLGPFRQPVVA